jgi:hypothetical protein
VFLELTANGRRIWTFRLSFAGAAKSRRASSTGSAFIGWTKLEAFFRFSTLAVSACIKHNPFLIGLLNDRATEPNGFYPENSDMATSSHFHTGKATGRQHGALEGDGASLVAQVVRAVYIPRFQSDQQRKHQRN